MTTRTVLPIVALLALASLATGCRPKLHRAPTPPDKPSTFASLSQLCTGTKKGFSDVKGYSKHADGTPSYVAFFQNGERGFSAAERAHDTGYAALHYTSLDAFAGSNNDSELTVCVDMRDMTEEHGLCSYYGASVNLRGREYHVRVLETKTGDVLSEETFTTSHRTEPCPSTVHGSGNIYVSPEKHLLATIARFEPDGSKFSPANLSDLNGVCTGTGVPQAAAGDTGAVDVVFFPGNTTSWSNELPRGMNVGAPRPTTVSGYSRVLCVTQLPTTRIQSCAFTSGKQLDVYAGEFEAELRDARTARVLETRRFQGKGSACPTLHTFNGSRDVVIPEIDASYAAWLLGLSPAGNEHARGVAPSPTTTAL
jgi:hypothetical protein